MAIGCDSIDFSRVAANLVYKNTLQQTGGLNFKFQQSFKLAFCREFFKFVIFLEKTEIKLLFVSHFSIFVCRLSFSFFSIHMCVPSTVNSNLRRPYNIILRKNITAYGQQCSKLTVNRARSRDMKTFSSSPITVLHFAPVIAYWIVLYQRGNHVHGNHVKIMQLQKCHGHGIKCDEELKNGLYSETRQYTIACSKIRVSS